MKGFSIIRAILFEKTPTLLFRRTICINFITMLAMMVSVFSVLIFLDHDTSHGDLNFLSPKLITLFSMIFISLFLMNLFYLKESLASDSKEDGEKDKALKSTPKPKPEAEKQQQSNSFDFSELYHNITKILIKRVEKYGANHITHSESNLKNLGKMIAHDIRKPFSMLNHYLLFVQDIASPEEIRETTHMFAEEMEKAIDAVDNLLKILLEEDYEFKLKKEVITPEYIVQSALEETMKKHPDTNVSVNYKYQHTGMVQVDAMKIHDVCVSIIDNAVTTMTSNDTLIISTKENSTSDYITLSIRHTGSYIDETDAARFFDIFYSHEGNNGNSLSLAISKQIISAHGGQMWCHSSREEEYIQINVTLPKT